jgi:hypothetical protein
MAAPAPEIMDGFLCVALKTLQCDYWSRNIVFFIYQEAVVWALSRWNGGAVKLSALCAGCTLLPWFFFPPVSGTHFC